MIPILLVFVAALSWANGVTAGCFMQNPPSRPQLHPTIFKHCLDGIAELVKYDKAMAPTLFSRKPGLGFKLPYHLSSRSCVVLLDMHSDDDEDLLSFYEIGIEAGVLNGFCVARPPHLGGTYLVGPKQVMNVSLYGRAPGGPFLPTDNRIFLPHGAS